MFLLEGVNTISVLGCSETWIRAQSTAHKEVNLGAEDGCHHGAQLRGTAQMLHSGQAGFIPTGNMGEGLALGEHRNGEVPHMRIHSGPQVTSERF